jgi:predicted dienelactone hydrolase
MTKLSALYRENAEHCVELAEAAKREQDRNRYKRMEAAWLALAEEQDWLDGERPPVDLGQAERKVRRNRRPSSASKLAKINLRRQLSELKTKSK